MTVDLVRVRSGAGVGVGDKVKNISKFALIKIYFFQESLSKSERTCNEVEEKLRITEEEAKRDIELRIQVSDGANSMKCFPGYSVS